MYRSFILLLLCFKTSLSAPQQSGIETIAEVKPTIFDYPAEVYDDVSQSYKEAAIVNGGRQDLSSDDFSYGITTENIELDTTEYADDGYERIPEPEQPTDDYENEKKTTRFYSKIGYFLNPYLVEDNLNGLGKLSKVEMKQSNHEYSTATPNVGIANNAKDKETYEDISNIKKENAHIVDVKSDIDKTKPIRSADMELNILNNETSSAEEKPSIMNNQNRIESNIENKRSYAVSKQSHFGGSQKLGYTTVSMIHKTGKRKFRSNCRCEKIWNCPRLQISVPRCPNEYFMCCF